MPERNIVYEIKKIHVIPVTFDIFIDKKVNLLGSHCNIGL